MPRRLNWTDLRGGIIAAAVIVAVVLVTVFFARVGALHGKKVTLYVLADDATGVLPGTEVWLAGKHAGTVRKVEFRVPTADTTNRLLFTTEFLARDLPYVRRDSWAQVQSGGTLLATPVVYVAIGSPGSPALGDGDTLYSRPKPRVLDVAAQVSDIMPEVRGLMAEVSGLNTKISRPVGTIGNYRTNGMPKMADVAGGMSRIGGRMNARGGTVGRLMSGNLTERASAVMARVDSLKLLAASGEGSIGRFRRDTTLIRTAMGLSAELDSLRAQAKGFAGPDTTLKMELARRRVLMDALIADIKSNPTRYINF